PPPSALSPPPLPVRPPPRPHRPRRARPPASPAGHGRSDRMSGIGAVSGTESSRLGEGEPPRRTPAARRKVKTARAALGPGKARVRPIWGPPSVEAESEEDQESESEREHGRRARGAEDPE